MIMDIQHIKGTQAVKVLSFEASPGNLEEVEMLTALAQIHIQGSGSFRITRPDGSSREWNIDRREFLAETKST